MNCDRSWGSTVSLLQRINVPLSLMKSPTDLFDALLRPGLVAERGEGVASVQAGHGVYHEPEVVNLAALFQQRHQDVFKDVPWDFTDEDLDTGKKKARTQGQETHDTSHSLCCALTKFHGITGRQ